MMSLMIIHTFIKRQDCFTHICHILNCKICKRCIVYSSPVTLLWNFCVVSMCLLSRVEPIPTHFALFNPCFVCWNFSSHQTVCWAFMFSVGDNQSFCEYFTVLQVYLKILFFKFKNKSIKKICESNPMNSWTGLKAIWTWMFMVIYQLYTSCLFEI